MYNTVIFDLDGTLVDSAPGIRQSFLYAIEALALPVQVDEGDWQKYIGPPLYESAVALGCDEPTAHTFVQVYREHHVKIGALNNSPYKGIPELLAELHSRKCCLAVATTKPTHIARIVLEAFDLSRYFQAVWGAEPGDTASVKHLSIQEILRTAPLPGVMVGDRASDVEAAHGNGLPAIGVLYGYGSQDELAAGNADQLVASVEELREILCA